MRQRIKWHCRQKQDRQESESRRFVGSQEIHGFHLIPLYKVLSRTRIKQARFQRLSARDFLLGRHLIQINNCYFWRGEFFDMNLYQAGIESVRETD
ncbi:hypothetical protein PMI29_03052 [Pseudomonas sp. GM49]|nr:hypothetical protein PMI29_03052 [Pseudomonas sp. GM49]